MLRRLRVFSKVASAFAILVGGIVLVGWMLDIAIVKSVLPNSATMKANTAAAFVLLGLSLWQLSTPAGPTRWWTRSLGYACAILVVLIGMLTLAEYSFSRDLGIDQLLVKDLADAPGTVAPGRMGPYTAFNCLMLAIALLALDLEIYRHRPAQFIALITAPIALLALVGYVYGVELFFYGFGNFTQMALHTAITFLALGLGVLSARPDRGLMSLLSSDTVGGAVARRLLPAAIVILVAVGWLRLQGERLGLYPTAFGTAFLITASITLFGTVIWWVVEPLNRADLGRQQAEATLQNAYNELSRVNRALRTISDCNQELVRAESETDLLNKICPIIVEIGGYRMAWVGYAENDERRTIRLAARAGGDDGFFENLDLAWGDTEHGHTPMGTAIRTSQPTVVHVATDAVYEPWRAAALQRGYAACIALPLRAGENAFGGLGIFAAEPEAFDAAEVKLLAELANDLAYGLSTLRTRAAHAQAEDALRRSEELLLKTSRMARVGGWELDLTTMTPRWSEETYRIHEVDPSVQPDLEGAINFYAPEARPVISAAVQKAIAEGAAYDLELPFITATGKRLWVRAQGQPEFQNGQCVWLSGTFQDITQRKHAEAAVLQSQARLAGIIDSAMDAIISVDASQRVVLFNAAAERMFQCPSAEAIGQPLDRFLPERFRAAHRRHIQLFGETGITNRRMGALGDLRGLRAGGVEFPIDVSISQVDDGGQKLFTAILRDVTERQRMEEQLRELVARLERNNRELQDFAYVASHDLQEPLRKIMAFGDRLKAQSGAGLDEKGRDYLERMQAAAARMRTLIDDLLTFSRVTTKAQPFTPVNLRRVADEVLSDLEVRLEKTGGRVEVGELPTIDADPTQMRQVFQNLLGNALKFHKPGQPPVVRLSASLDGLTCQITVADNGIGFDEKYLDRIFTPFQRLHGRGEYEGTGIGLAVVRKIAERHGGSVTARSAPGQGATFIVTLSVKPDGE